MYDGRSSERTRLAQRKRNVGKIINGIRAQTIQDTPRNQDPIVEQQMNSQIEHMANVVAQNVVLFKKNDGND